MKQSLCAAAVAALFSSSSAMAGTIKIDFETAPSFATVGQTYSGLGVTFGDALWGLQNDVLGPYFSNAPSPIGTMGPVGTGTTAAAFAMDVAGGFGQYFGFWYSSSQAVASAVQVWSGLDGTGSLLASINLLANAQSNGCSDSPYCNFTQASANLNSIARSVTFANAADVALFDNLVIPEPSTTMLVGLALTGLMLARRRT